MSYSRNLQKADGVCWRRIKVALGALFALAFVHSSAFAYTAFYDTVVDRTLSGNTVRHTIIAFEIRATPQDARSTAFNGCSVSLSSAKSSRVREVRGCELREERIGRCVSLISVAGLSNHYFIVDTFAEAQARGKTECGDRTSSAGARQACELTAQQECDPHIRCPEETPEYNVDGSTMQATCDACEAMEYFDSDPGSGRCKPLMQCPSDGSIRINPLTEECPNDCDTATQYYDTATRACVPLVACMDGSTSNPRLLEVCEETCTMKGEDYDPDSKTCMACISPRVFNAATTECECATGDTENINGMCVNDVLSCTGGSLPNAANDACVCVSGDTKDVNGM